MNKKTISTILNIIMGLLTVGIVVLVVLISMRGPKPTVTEDSIADIVVSDNDVADIDDEVSDNDVELVPDLICVPDKSSTSVNVRSGAGTDYDRIGSAYPDCEYLVYSVTSSGWTEVEYDGQSGFISSEFLSYQYRYELGDGTYTYEPVTGDVAGYKAEEK